MLKQREHQNNLVQSQATRENEKQLLVLKKVYKPSQLFPLKLKRPMEST